MNEGGMSSRGMSSGRETRRGRGEEWKWGIRISEEIFGNSWMEQRR